MVNLIWLRSYCTLVEVGSFTKTATRLHMTQSGVSQHIRKLEEQMGTQLLIRQGKQFTLSDAGELLFDEAQSILTSLANLERKITDDPPFEGSVSVMSPGSVGLKVYPKLLTLQESYPKLVIDYRFAPNKDVENAIASSKTDIGFMTSRSHLTQVSCRPVATEQLLLITPATERSPDWQTLTELGFIDHPDGYHHADLLLGANFDEYESVTQFVNKGFSNQISLILEPVSRGLGFTVLPAHAVNAFGQQAKISVHPLSNPVEETLYLCTRRDKVLQNRMETVIEEARRWLL